MTRVDGRNQRADLDALAAQQRLADTEGHPQPCRDRLAAWTSEKASERAQAAEGCSWCWEPLRAACAVAGQHERHGVWGGRDRSRGGR